MKLPDPIPPETLESRVQRLEWRMDGVMILLSRIASSLDNHAERLGRMEKILTEWAAALAHMGGAGSGGGR
jgi:hypothetical protein